MVRGWVAVRRVHPRRPLPNDMEKQPSRTTSGGYMRKNLWSDEDTATARILLARNASFEEFFTILGRSKAASKTRIQYLDNENVRYRKYEHVKRQRTHRRLTGSAPPPSQRHVTRMSAGAPPAHVLADAAARSNAPRTLSAMLLGDPPIGFSALDRRS